MHKTAAITAVLSIIGGSVMPLTAFAVSPHVAAIQVETLNGNSPSFYSTTCTGENPLHSPVTIVGSGTVTGPLGSGPDKYHVSVDWGDGVTDVVASNFTVLPSGDYTFTFSGGPHNYGSTAVSSITANVYHQNSSGHDTPDASSLTISLCVTPITHTITATAAANGTINPSGAVSVADGANQAFTIAANALYHIVDVIIDAATTATHLGPVTSYTFTNVTADHTIDASFAADAVTTYTITATQGAHGTISPAGATVVNAGANQAYTITPDAGYHIVDVTTDEGSQGTSGSYTFTNVQANHTITATFAIDEYTITASAGANGTISPNGATNVASGGSQSYTITAANGYHVADVLVDGSSVGAVTTYPFTGVTANHTISATFAQTILTITASVDGGHGTIDPAGGVNVPAGGTQAFTLTPNSGYDVDTLLVDGVSVSTSSPYTFSNVDTGHTIVVKFKGILECNDGIDNDGDGTIDGSDQGCISSENTTENEAPSADSQSVSTFKNTAKSITLTGSDPEGNTITFTVTGNPAHGTLTGTAPDLTYTPDTDYTGTDSFTFIVNDGSLNSSTATVTIDVNPPITQCNDKLDNDSDDRIDSADPACHTDYDASNEESYDPSIDNESRVDMCSNIDGYQESVPAGYHQIYDGRCIKNGGDSTTTTVTNEGGGGSVLGESTTTEPVPQVLGESCGLYMDKHLRLGSKKNDSAQTLKLQAFLNKHMNAGLPATGFFGKLTEAAVKKFQNQYADAILKPWGVSAPTGLVYFTTLHKINEIECPEAAGDAPSSLIEWSKNPNAQ